MTMTTQAGTMKSLPATLAVVVIALAYPQTIGAQTTQPPTNIAVRVTEARKANAALMRQYSWTSRTEVFDQGQVKDTHIDAVNYGPGGQLQRSVLNDQSNKIAAPVANKMFECGMIP